jgi:hypothetical protein
MLKNFGKGNFKDGGTLPVPDVILRCDHEMKWQDIFFAIPYGFIPW